MAYVDEWSNLNKIAPLGDVLKYFQSIYDKDANGIVDNADKVNGLTVLTAVPLNALFTDTTYSIGDGGLTERNFTTILLDKLNLIEAGATADQTGAEIKSLYESELDTNAFTDLEKLKLSYLTVSQLVDLDAMEVKLDFITVTQPVDLDAIELRVNQLDASVVLKGLWDASVGTFPTSTKSGESWIVSVGGTVDGVEFKANDRIVATVDNASSTVYASNWHKLDYTDAVLSVDGNTGAIDLTSTYSRLSVSNLFTAVQGCVVTTGANAIDFTGTNVIRFTASAANITIGTMATKKGQEFAVVVDSAETATGWGTEFLFAPDFSAVTPTPPATMTGTMMFYMYIAEVNGVDGGTANKVHVSWAQ